MKHWKCLILYLECDYFHSLILSVISLTSFQGNDLAIFLNPYFKANGFGLALIEMASTNVEEKKKLSLLIFTDLLHPSLLVWLVIHYLIFILIPTALLICTENTFWDMSRDGNFVELFKKSFTLYVESGMSERMKIDIDILRNDQGEFLVTEVFKARFYRFIVEHYLRKFHCFYLHLTHLTTFFT